MVRNLEEITTENIEFLCLLFDYELQMRRESDKFKKEEKKEFKKRMRFDDTIKTILTK